MSAETVIVYSRDGEYFDEQNLDDFESGDGYYSGERADVLPSSLVSKWVIDDILERMDESLAEVCGEAAEDALSLAGDKQDELEKIIRDFMDKHCTITCYRVVNVQEHVAGSNDYRQGGAA